MEIAEDETSVLPDGGGQLEPKNPPFGQASDGKIIQFFSLIFDTREPVSFVVDFCKADHDTVLEKIGKMLLIRLMNFY